MANNPIIVWFREDLRLTHNAALYHASKMGVPIIPIYILDDYVSKKWKMGSAQRWWLYKSLNALKKKLAKHHLKLIFRRGDAKKIVETFLKETSAKSVYWNRCYDPYSLKRDEKISKALTAQGFHSKDFPGSLLFEPWEIKNKQGKYYRVFTPFWKTCLKKIVLSNTLPVPHLKAYRNFIKSDAITDWDLLPKPTEFNWTEKLNQYWDPGERGAFNRLDQFIKTGLEYYEKGRDYPALEVTSKLSPHLHFGEITALQIWHIVEKEAALSSRLQRNVERFYSQLGWREFSYHLLYHFPRFPDISFHDIFNHFPWENKIANLKAWQSGQTGYPIIDAGMRQLWETGWMHNRVRMIVASFLIKDLFIDWRKGEQWFWDTLVDADLANNAASWQWVAGSGADAAPYIRVFNPILQGQKFDAKGDYVRTWVPELAKLPNKYIHAPWEAPGEILAAANITLGKDYPKPIVDHYECRNRALMLFKKLQK